MRIKAFGLLVILGLVGAYCLWAPANQVPLPSSAKKSWAERSDRVLVCRARHGWGNRLRAIVSAIVAAHASDRELWIDWSQGWEMPLPIAAFFKTPFNLVSEEELAQVEVLDYDLRPLNPVPALNLRDDDTPIIVVTTWWIVREETMPYSEAMDQYQSVISRLRFSEPATSRAAEFIRQNNIRRDRDIGVHFRGWTKAVGDMEGWKCAEDEEFFKEMDKVSPEARFVLATDDLDVVRRFQERYGERIIHSGISRVARDNEESMLDAFFEWMLLGSTRYIVGTRWSSFSETASCFTHDKKCIVVGPEDIKAPH